MKKYTRYLLILCGIVLFSTPHNVFAGAKCSTAGIDVSQWEFTEGDCSAEEIENGYCKKICCSLGSVTTGTIHQECDNYKLKEGEEPIKQWEVDINDPQVVKHIETDESKAVACPEGTDLSNFTFNYTYDEKDSYTNPGKGSENYKDARICCTSFATGHLTGGAPKWRCSYYVSNSLIEQGYETIASRLAKKEETEEREDLEDITGNLTANCEAIFDPDAQALIKRIFGIICVIVPVLLIVLGCMDFGNAVLSSDQEALQKAVKKFTTRCIIAVAVFFLPLIVNLVFKMPGMNEIGKIFYCNV